MSEMPTWEGFMIPCLEALRDGSVQSRRDINGLVSEVVGLKDDQRAVVLSSGQPMYANRIGWALSQLTRVGALTRPSRGLYQLTEAGRQVLAQFPGGTPGSPSADYDNDTDVDVGDLFGFLDCWFAAFGYICGPS